MGGHVRSEKVVGMLKSGPFLCRSLSPDFLSGAHRGFQGGKACGSSLTACCSTPGGPFSSCGGHWSGHQSQSMKATCDKHLSRSRKQMHHDPRVPCPDCGRPTSAWKLAHHTRGCKPQSLGFSFSPLSPFLSLCLSVYTFSHPNSSLVT